MLRSLNIDLDLGLEAKTLASALRPKYWPWP